jgi:hypothetical protein
MPRKHRRHRPTTCVCDELSRDSLCVMRAMGKDEIRHTCLALNLWTDGFAASLQGGDPLIVFHDAYCGNLTLGGVLSYATLILQRRGLGKVNLAFFFE